jgi:hypothetical protein
VSILEELEELFSSEVSDLVSGSKDTVKDDLGCRGETSSLIFLGLLICFSLRGKRATHLELMRSILAILAATSAAVNVSPLDGADLFIGPLRYGGKPKAPRLLQILPVQ